MLKVSCCPYFAESFPGNSEAARAGWRPRRGNAGLTSCAASEARKETNAPISEMKARSIVYK